MSVQAQTNGRPLGSLGDNVKVRCYCVGYHSSHPRLHAFLRIAWRTLWIRRCPEEDASYYIDNQEIEPVPCQVRVNEGRIMRCGVDPAAQISILSSRAHPSTPSAHLLQLRVLVHASPV